jgi:hypothetical protein
LAPPAHLLILEQLVVIAHLEHYQPQVVVVVAELILIMPQVADQVVEGEELVVVN